MKKLIVLTSFSICFLALYGWAQQPKLMLPIGHTTRINAAAFSPDGKKIVTASRDNTAKTWDAQSGILLANLEGHTSTINSSLFSPDGTKILTASNKEVRIWDAQTGNLVSTIKSNAGINSAVFSPDGKKILTATDDSTAKLWNTSSGKLIISLKGSRGVVNSAVFSTDGRRIVTVSDEPIVKVWDALSGKLVMMLKGHRSAVVSAIFSPDGKRIATTSADSTAKIWDALTGKIVADLKGHRSNVISACFSPASPDDPVGGKRIVTSSYDSTSRVWDSQTGALLITLKGQGSFLSAAKYSPDGRKIVTASFYNLGKWDEFGTPSENNTAKIWDARTGILLANLQAHIWNVVSAVFSPDNKKVLTASWDGTAKLWDVGTGTLTANLRGHSFLFSRINFSPDGKKIATSSFNDNHAKIWDAHTGALLTVLAGHTHDVYSVIFSPDSKEVVTTSNDSTAKIWDAGTGELLHNLEGHKDYVFSAAFSPDGKKIITASGDFTAKIWDAQTGELLNTLDKHRASVISAVFSPDGKKIVTGSFDKTAKIWDAQTGNLLTDLPGHSWLVMSAIFSPDSKKIVTVSGDSTAKIWDAETGALLTSLEGSAYRVKAVQFDPNRKNILLVSNSNTVKLLDIGTPGLLKPVNGFTQNGYKAEFSPDGKKIFIASLDSTSKIWNPEDGKLLADMNQKIWNVIAVTYSPDNKKLLTTSYDGTAKVWNTETGELLYTFLEVDSSDYLVTGKYKQYDGSPGARKLIYFVCNDEVIWLDQVKDQLWVPNLAERINKGETINAKKIEDLDLCGLTPVTEEGDSKPGEYCFRITPRRGGLGETILYVNGIEAGRYSPGQLINRGGVYELRVKKEEIRKYFIAGRENPVTVKAYTADNAISSRIISITADETEQSAPPPNLYAVMVGISDYKGEELDLKYAAKDATDISNAIAVAAKKLLNADGKEHVFMYNLTTAAGHYQLPEKNSIKNLLAEIGAKATANDILLIFFAGHGKMEGVKKQFYFLTADASPSSAFSAVADVGISTSELTEWMKPATIKAQKRVLIFDACNSGQAIRDFVKIGSPDQNYMSARGDEQGQQAKAIDKLNEQSGFFILSASASDQNAYEFGRYSQGLLTYSLLRAIKLQPDILENGKYLDVSRWFNAAGKTVSELSKENSARQQPQLIANTNFNIGVVDEDVMTSIVLPPEKPTFAASIFLNSDPAISDDDLELSKMVNSQLADISSRGLDGRIYFATGSRSSEAFEMTGTYSVNANSVTVKVNVKQNKEIKHRFEMSGTKDKLKELVAAIAYKAAEVVK